MKAHFLRFAHSGFSYLIFFIFGFLREKLDNIVENWGG